MVTRNKRYRSGYGLLLAPPLLLFFLPALAGWGRIFFDDIAFIFYPQQVFLSRWLARGVIPWWDPHICAGGMPFYAHSFQSSLYPINWLFLYLGHLLPSGNFFWLVRAPLVLHYLLAAVFAYLFARFSLKLHRIGSAVLSLAYTLSPTMIYMSTYPPEVFIQAWLPLFCLCLLMFSRKGSWGWIILGTLSFALASPAGDMPFVFHVVTITGLFGLSWIILQAIQREFKQAIRTVIALLLIFIAGGLLAGLYWSNMADGLFMLVRETTQEVKNLSGPHQSLYPIYLITLIVPDFFGGVSSQHTWGAAYQIHCSLNDVNLSGGMAAFLIIALGFSVGIQRRRQGSNAGRLFRLWWIFFAVFMFGIFTVLGAYTPIYRLLRLLVPVLRMPYPVRFRSIECFAFVGWLGVSVNLLLVNLKLGSGRVYSAYSRAPVNRGKLSSTTTTSSGEESDFQRDGRVNIRRWVWRYVMGLSILILPVLIWPYQDGRQRYFPGFLHLSALHDWGWFVTGPLFYVLAVGFVLMLGVGLLNSRRFVKLLILLAVGEILFFAYGAFYRNKIFNRRHEDISSIRYRGPRSDPDYRLISDWIKRTPGRPDYYRRLHFRSDYDNLAWVNGTLSMPGFDIKPLDPRFQGIIKRLTEGFPYELRIKKWDSRFWANMSVRWALSRRSLSPAAGYEFQGKIGEYNSYELLSSLPRLYFQDRWVVVDGPRGEEEALLDHDLREHGCCAGNVWAARPSPEEYPKNGKPDPAARLEHFQRLQEDNKIISADFSNPNRVVIEADISRSCMLVMTDVWNQGWKLVSEIGEGEGNKIYRVNYLQRGIWCRPGRCRIEMEFKPPSLGRGFLMTWLGVAGLAVLAGAWFKQRRRKG